MSQWGHNYPPQQPFPQYQQPYQTYQQQYPQHAEQGYAYQQQPMLPPAGYQHGYYDPHVPRPQQPQPTYMYQQPGQLPQPPIQYAQVAPRAQYPPPQGMHMQPPLPHGQAGMYPAGPQGVPVPTGQGYPGSSGGAAHSSHMGGQMQPHSYSQQGASVSEQHQQSEHHTGHQTTPQQQGQQQQQNLPPPPQQEQQHPWQGYEGQDQQQATQGQHDAPVPPPQQGPGIPQGSAGSADSTPVPVAGGSDTGSSHQQMNSGSVLLAALQNQQGGAASNRSHTAETAAAPASVGSTTSPAAATGADSTAAAGSSRSTVDAPLGLHKPHIMGPDPGVASSSTSSSKQQERQGQVDPMGVYLVGLQPDITSQQLEGIFSAYGKVKNVAIITIKYHTTKCAFVNFTDAAAASQVLAEGIIDIGGHAVAVKPKVLKPKAAAQAQGEGSSSSGQAQQQQKQKSTKQAGSAGAGPSNSAGTSARVLGRNQEGLPMLRGAPCCPFYMGTGECAFRNNCRYHHPVNAFHPECVVAGLKPVRYNTAIMPPYARLVNHTERLWDYDSCAEAQLKIWLARHLIASENSGCGMFDESAAVPAAAEYDDFPNEAQPLGPYSCSIAEADQVLQLLWKAQPDEASQQVMPYKGRVWYLLSDDPYYKLAHDPSGAANPHKSWVQLRLANIKGLLNY